MLAKSNTIAFRLQQFMLQNIRYVSSTLLSGDVCERRLRTNKQTDINEMLEIIEASKSNINLAFTPSSESELQDIHDVQVADVQDNSIAHVQYDNYCRKDPEQIISMDNQYDKLNELISPLLPITDYYAQLCIKRERAIRPLKFLRRHMEIGQCYLRPMKIRPYFLCPMKVWRHRDLTAEYRNTSELSVNRGVDGEWNTVGYPLENIETGETLSVPPIKHPDTKNSHKIIAMFFQDFIQKNLLELNSAPWRIWREICIRSTEYRRKHMAIVKVAHCISEKDRHKMKQALIDVFFLGDFRNYGQLSSLYVQFGDSTEGLELLKGKDVLLEKIEGVKYEIGPSTVFPVNASAVGLLQGAISDSYDFDKSIVVLQMGCHSNFAMHLGAKARSVICIEGRKKFLDHGKRHAEINKFKNVEFFTYKYLSEIDKALDDHSAHFVAVVHSINGFNKNILYSLRQNPSVKAVIYIFHSFTHTTADLMVLCSKSVSKWHALSKKMPAPERFGPHSFIPIDMLPNTTNAEFVMLLSRESDLRRKCIQTDRKQFYEFNKNHAVHEGYEDNYQPSMNVDDFDEYDLR